MSKVDKLRGKLAGMQRDREAFEKQKKELEAQMDIGRQNMGKIQKGLKNNVILNDPITLELAQPIAQLTENINSSIAASQNTNLKKTNKSTNKNPPGNSPIALLAGQGGSFYLGGGQTAAITENIIIPSGPRVSDWCFVGPLDSTPPIVKSRELYENVRLLGRGSFGEVNLVKNVEDNKLFAIKTIFCSRDSEFEMVLKEIWFLRLNRHPCIIDVHDAFVTLNPRVVHIVMHYCESGTIASVIASAKKTKTSISEAQIVKWIVQLSLGMNFLHENHTLHRDLKPMNVMLTEGGDLLKLADFGLAINMDQAGATENFDEAGTPYYTAPEMIQRESYSYPADCWSLGVIIHQLLALERPFDGSSTADLVKAILIGDPPPLPGHYSEELKSLSRDLLKKNPAERLTTAALLSAPLIFPKVNSFPQSYRPRYLEERIRRSHLRQLEQQLDSVTTHRRQSQTIAAVGRGKSSASSSFSVPLDSPHAAPGRSIEGFGRISPLMEDLGGSVSEKIPTAANNDSNYLLASSPSAAMFVSVAAVANEGAVTSTTTAIDAKELTTEQTLQASVSEIVLGAHKAAAGGPVSISAAVIDGEQLQQILQLHELINADATNLLTTTKHESSPAPHGGRKGLELAHAKRQDQEILEATSEGQE